MRFICFRKLLGDRSIGTFNPRFKEMFVFRKGWQIKFIFVACLATGIVIFSKSGNSVLSNTELRFRKELAKDSFKVIKKITTTVPQKEILKIRPKTMVIILTYMRSGSSLTGDLIQQSPDVFYVYEPLFTLGKFWHNPQMLKFFNKIDKPMKKIYYNNQSLEIIESMLTCNPFNIDIETLRQYHYRGSLSTSRYMNCLKHSPGVMGTASCLPIFVKACAKSKLSLVKTIRMSLNAIAPLLEKHPSLKIIHLIRDPRGTLRSQKKVGEATFADGGANSTSVLCNRINNDLAASELLSKKYPKRIKTIRYEDIAERPIAATENLYKFLGLSVTKKIKDYIWNITSAGHADNCLICTTRKNSVATAYKWREVLPFSIVKMIDKTCSKVYDRLGYFPLKNKHDQASIKVAVKKTMKFDP